MKKFTKFLVAIVDDSPIYSAMIEHVLSKDKDIDVICFESAEECIECFMCKPNVIILDHKLGGMDGIRALKPLRKLHKHIPIIIMSSQKDINVVIEYMNHGATDYIVKNMEGLELLAKEIEAMKNCEPYLEKNILNQIYQYFTPA